MRTLRPAILKIYWAGFYLFLLCMFSPFAYSATELGEEKSTVDRIHLVMQQINLLKNRHERSLHELTILQQQQNVPVSAAPTETINKSMLDKASLDISVAKSNLDSIHIELTDSQQIISWLEKNIQEIQNQLNILNMFGVKALRNEVLSPQELRTDLAYQQQLLTLEKVRVRFLQDLQTEVSGILRLRKEKHAELNELLKSRKLLQIKQQQVRDELAYQELQNLWLKKLNALYARLEKIDINQDKKTYAAIERDIYYANESASFAYVQSLIARYQDQAEQMNLAVTKNNSISLLNDLGNQFQILSKQVNRLNSVLTARIKILHKHITNLSQKRKNDEAFSEYLSKLTALEQHYHTAEHALDNLNESLLKFRKLLDKSLQTELSARQGLPNISIKMFVDLGKETLLLPALAFQVIKSLSLSLLKSFQSTGIFLWSVFALLEIIFLALMVFIYQYLKYFINKPSSWREQINSKWLSLQWLKRNFIDLCLIANLLGLMGFFKIPIQHYQFLIYLFMVWIIFKSIHLISRICLVETTHDTTGHDVRLYHRLKWIILVGGAITGLTVFVHQLPLMFELSTLCDRLFLLFLMLGSLLLLRSWQVLPNLIISHIDSPNVYFEKSIRLIGVLIPVLIFGNSLIGLFGFLNLVMTVIWYEGLFLIVLMTYLVLRGLLSDGMQQLSQLMVKHVHNGWLWTEAFLKPLDKILRIVLFLSAWGILFILYGWDKQSPMVERLNKLLHYKLASVLNTSINLINIIELFVVISVFYWTAKWTREFVYRMLASRTKDMGIRNSIAILSQYSIIALAVFICLRVLGIDLSALVAVAGLFAFGVGLGLRDLANNFACGFLILLERPLRVGDIVSINGVEGEVLQIGSRAVRIKTWDLMDLMVPNTEIFNKTFINWTARDNIVRCVFSIKISRHDNPHEVMKIIQTILTQHKNVLKDPPAEVFLKEMNDVLLEFEIRFFVNIRQVSSRVSIMSEVLMKIWDEFLQHGIKPPYPQQEIFLRNESPPALAITKT